MNDRSHTILQMLKSPRQANLGYDREPHRLCVDALTLFCCKGADEPLNHQHIAEARLHLGHVSGSGLRPLNILDMPTEILVEIIERVQLGDAEFGLDSIQACRLTCRRLSHIADSFLITDGTLRLSLDKESLAKVEIISRNPTLRNKVKTVELDLALFADIEGIPFSAFAWLAASLLDLALGKYSPEVGEFTSQEHWPEGVIDVMQRIHDDVGLIHDACHFLRNFPDTPGGRVGIIWASLNKRGLLRWSKDCKWSDMEPLVDALVKQAETYAELFREQQSLLEGEFVSRLVTAMSQMGNLDAIRFTEWDLNTMESTTEFAASLALWNKARNKGTVRFPFQEFIQNPDQPAIDILVQSNFFLRRLPMMRIGEGPLHLFSFMAQFMDGLTTSKLSHVVKNLDIGFWGSGIHPMEPAFRWRGRGLASTWLTFGVESEHRGLAYTEHQRQIHLATQNLESFSLTTVCDNMDRSGCPCSQKRMEVLLSPFLQAPKLRRVNIHHAPGVSGYPCQPFHESTGSPWVVGPRPLFSNYRGYIGRGLGVRVSPFLTDITLQGVALHEQDLVKFLRHGLERPLDQLHLGDIKLQTGTWRTMLEFIRSLKSSESALPKSLVNFKGGELRRRQWEEVAAEHHPSDPQCVVDFINGKEDEPNPIERLGWTDAMYMRLRAEDKQKLRSERDWQPHNHAGDETESSDTEEEETE